MNANGCKGVDVPYRPVTPDHRFIASAGKSALAPTTFGTVMRSAILPIVLGATARVVAQQPASYELVPSDPVAWQVPMDLGGGTTCYATQHIFDNDSMRFELMWTDADKTVTHATAFRMEPIGSIVNLMDAVHLTNGFVMTAFISGGPVWTEVLAVDEQGEVLWGKTLTNVYRQSQTAGLLIPRGNLFTLYGQGGGSNYDGFARVEADITGTQWTGINMQPPDSAQYTLYSAFPTAVPSVHMAYGTGVQWNDMPNWKTVVMQTSDTGAVWMRMYTMPPEHTVPNDPYDMRPTTDGNYICSGGYRENNWLDNRGYLMKLDPGGDVLWCRVYADTSGYFTLNSVVELPGGDLLAAGQAYGSRCVLLRIAPDGTMIGQRRLSLPDTTWNTIGKFAVNTLGAYTLAIRNRLIGLSAEGETCDLVAYSGVTDSLFMPTVTSVDLANVPFTPTMDTLTVEPRTPSLSWQQSCLNDAITEPASEELKVYPNPTEGMVFLEGLRPHERVVVLASDGTRVYDGPCSGTLRLAGHSAGVYVVHLPRTGQRVLLLKR